MLFDHVLSCLIILGKIHKPLDISIAKLLPFKIPEADNPVIVGLKENTGEKRFKACALWCENHMGLSANQSHS